MTAIAFFIAAGAGWPCTVLWAGAIEDAKRRGRARRVEMKATIGRELDIGFLVRKWKLSFDWTTPEGIREFHRCARDLASLPYPPPLGIS